MRSEPCPEPPHHRLLPHLPPGKRLPAFVGVSRWLSEPLPFFQIRKGSITVAKQNVDLTMAYIRACLFIVVLVGCILRPYVNRCEPVLRV